MVSSVVCLLLGILKKLLDLLSHCEMGPFSIFSNSWILIYIYYDNLVLSNIVIMICPAR